MAGSFFAAWGEKCQCVVVQDSGEILIVDYISNTPNPLERTCGAEITRSSFRYQRKGRPAIGLLMRDLSNAMKIGNPILINNSCLELEQGCRDLRSSLEPK